jgi:superfamily II DNA helicase RecQ
MLIRIFTLPFDEVTQGFPDHIIADFCLNKKVHEVKSRFFVSEGKAYWSVSILYELLPKGEEKIRELDDTQKAAYTKLKEWRKLKGEQEGFPVYLICNNAQLMDMVLRKCITLEALKDIKGFGRKKIDKYGKQIIEIIKGFYLPAK